MTPVACYEYHAIVFSPPAIITAFYVCGGLYINAAVKHKFRLDDPVLCPGCGITVTHWYCDCGDGAIQLFAGALSVKKEAGR